MMSHDTCVDSSIGDAVDLSLARAVVSRTLALGLRPPGEALAADLADDASLEALRQATRLLDREGGESIETAVEELLALRPLRPADLAPRYQALFGHTLRGAVCPYEAEYGRRPLLQQAQELADLTGFYRAFGLQVVVEARERPDHIACELEFLGFLARKQAHALGVADHEMAALTSVAQRRFLAQHVGRFGRAFARRLEEAAARGIYAGLARLLRTFLDSEYRRLELPPGPETLELRAWEPNDAPMACGGEPESDELVQLTARGAGAHRGGCATP